MIPFLHHIRKKNPKFIPCILLETISLLLILTKKKGGGGRGEGGKLQIIVSSLNARVYADLR